MAPLDVGDWQFVWRWAGGKCCGVLNIPVCGVWCRAGSGTTPASTSQRAIQGVAAIGGIATSTRYWRAARMVRVPGSIWFFFSSLSRRAAGVILWTHVSGACLSSPGDSELWYCLPHSTCLQCVLQCAWWWGACVCGCSVGEQLSVSALRHPPSTLWVRAFTLGLLRVRCAVPPYRRRRRSHRGVREDARVVQQQREQRVRAGSADACSPTACCRCVAVADQDRSAAALCQ